MQWKRSRRRGVSVGRIAVLVVLLGLAGATGLWRMRPAPLSWHSVGAERIVTAAFDIADGNNRQVLDYLRRQSVNLLGGKSLDESCFADAATPPEIYLLTIVQLTSHTVGRRAVLVRVRSTGDGEILVESHDDSAPGLTRLPLTPMDVDDFRAMLLEGGYPTTTPSESADFRRDSRTIALQSCVRGRYYGFARASPFADEGPPPFLLANRIDAMARSVAGHD